MSNGTKAPAVPAPKSEAVVNKPTDPKAPAPVAKKERVKLPSIYPTAEAAIAEAAKRTSGPRRAFKVATKDGKEHFCVTYNYTTAGTEVLMNVMGATAEELGKPPRAAKVPTAESLIANLEALPEAEKAKVKEAMAKLLGK